MSDLQAGLSAGDHFMQEGAVEPHGCPPNEHRHTGDMV